VERNKLLILGKELLFNEGVKYLMLQQAHLDVNEDFITDLESLPEAVKRLQPRIIVIDLNSYAGNLLCIYRALREVPSIRIILINPHTNKVEVFDRKTIQIHLLSDFLLALDMTEGGK
jgi:DNA-binding NarL/FixJ family response regulator